MDGTLTTGQQLKSVYGVTYQVVEKLGEGGQGEVYAVSQSGKNLALKWYFERTARPRQRSIIENLMKKGPPDSSFLWPIDIIDGDSRFGYVMPLRPKKYRSIVDLMKRRAEPTFRTLAIACFNVASGYKRLHESGYCYCDISFGNLFFDPDSGDVMICDNDNVVVNGMDNGILGTPRFMAPEIVRGERRPSTDTDLYSMALLFFYMLMIHHPLEGAREAKIKALDVHAMRQLYGTHPVFIWDPRDESNRPDPAYQSNAIKFWNLYPQFLKDAFIRSFSEGLSDPKKRLLEKQWMDIFAALIDSVLYCPKCGVEVFFDEEKRRMRTQHLCWNCGRLIELPPILQIGKKALVLRKDALLLRHHTKDDYDIRGVDGQVVQNPNDPSLWGIRNLSDDVWIYVKRDGTQSPVGRGKAAPISHGARIIFGVQTGEFRT